MIDRSIVERDDRWERRFNLVMAVHPYVLMAVSVALALLAPGAGSPEPLVTVGLAALATAWVLVMYTWLDSRWPWPTAGRLVFFAGLLVLSGVLVADSPYFIAFACSCFVLALFLLPALLTVVGVLASAVIVYLVPIGFQVHTAGQVVEYAALIGVQTLLTGGFGFIGARMRTEGLRRRQLTVDLERALEENAELQVQLLAQAREAGVQDERGRMAGEIHDTLAQGLTGIVTQLEAAQDADDRGSAWRAHVEQAAALARESLAEARRSVQALRPGPLETARLPEAVEDMARSWSATSSVPLSFQVSGEARPLLAELEVALFRAAQEALVNVARHASASRVGLTLSYMDDVVLLDVRDDGVGFDTDGLGDARPRDGHRFGLRAMAERLRHVGGGLEIESAPGAGTAISARVPAVEGGG